MHGTLKKTKIRSRRSVITEADLKLYDELACAEARQSYWAFRCYLDPSLLKSWFQRDVAMHLQDFYDDFRRGLRPKLVLGTPPQHGKTRQITEFIAWVAGKDPDLASIFASYSEDLGVKVNLALQRIYTNPRYNKVFGRTRIWEPRRSMFETSRYVRTLSHLEYVNFKGSFRNTTIEGQVTGQSLDLGFIDDPIKGRKEAHSLNRRNDIWNWLTDDFFTRFADHAGLLMIMTRWHIDDPTGRFKEKFPDVKILKYDAIATKDGPYRKRGEALFPELKSLDFLMERKKLLTNASWEALYQQNPILVGGGTFPIEKFIIDDSEIDRRTIKRSVRYWDKAGTEDGGAYTCGVLMHEMDDKTFYIEDVVRGQWGALVREERIKQTAEIDGRRTKVWVEQEPGSGGKESAESTIRNLRGFIVGADKVTGSKEVRAEPYAAQVQGGNVRLRKAAWNRDYIDEHEFFPSGPRRDQVDASSGAFNKLVLGGSTYDGSMRWVDC